MLLLLQKDQPIDEEFIKKELQRIKKEKEEAMADPYQAAFLANRQGSGGSGGPVNADGGGDDGNE